MIVHAFMVELYQPDTVIQEKINKIVKICVQSQWRVVLLWYHIIIQAEFRPERETYKTLHD